MFGRRQAIQNPIVAKHMKTFFKGVTGKERGNSSLMAEAYARHLFHERRRQLVDDKKFSRSAFYVGLGMHEGGFERLTKRSLLVADTLLLSHNGPGEEHDITMLSLRTHDLNELNGRWTGLSTATSESLVLKCGDISALGRWITDSEPLLRAGLVWYLPKYSIQRRIDRWDAGSNGESRPSSESISGVQTSLDFLVRNGRAVEEIGGSGGGSVKSRVVRPILQMDLPFIEGVSMADASRITVEEFGSYRAVRRFFQESFLDLDAAVQGEHMEHELRKIGNQLEDEIRRVQSEMNIARRRRAMSVTGAVIGTVGAVLVAVYGPAMEAALPIFGAAGAGGVWDIVRNTAENSPRTLRDNRWYYVWLLAKNSNSYGI
jgi:hypothetical protein